MDDKSKRYAELYCNSKEVKIKNLTITKLKTTSIMKLIENIQMTQPDGEELGVLFIDAEGM